MYSLLSKRLISIDLNYRVIDLKRKHFTATTPLFVRFRNAKDVALLGQ